jgi:hypothetical protein
MDAMLVVDMQVWLLNGEPFGCPFLFFLVRSSSAHLDNSL